MLRFSVLGSGSGGNSAVLCSAKTTVLIDAGLSARQLCLRLQDCGVDPDSLDAVLVTHEHSDHVGGLDVFCRKRSLPIYATAHTCELVRERLRSEVSWKVFEAGGSFTVGDLEVNSFSVPHDAVDPVGFVVREMAAGLGVGVLSDVGHVTAMTCDHLKELDVLFVEANYDEVMLQNDVRRPWPTKQRISSRHGHLSNEQAAELVARVATPRLRHVVLGHLSSDCNCPKLAAAVVRERLEKSGFDAVTVECAKQRAALPMREFGGISGAAGDSGSSEQAWRTAESPPDRRSTGRRASARRVPVSRSQAEWSF